MQVLARVLASEARLAHIRMLRNRQYPCRFQGPRKDFGKSECVLIVAYARRAGNRAERETILHPTICFGNLN